MKCCTKLVALTVTVLSALAGCAGSDKKDSDSLDVSLEEKTGKDASLPATAVSDWQAFFKPPPTKNELGLLEQKLEKWSDSDSAESLLAKGKAEAAAGRSKAAEATFRRVLRMDPEQFEAGLELANLALKRSDLQTAFDLLTQVRDTINTSEKVTQSFIFRYRYVLALAHLAREETEKGHKILSDLIGAEKTFTPAYTALAASYLKSGRDSVAEFVIRRGLDRVKDPAPLMNLMGVISTRARQNEAARNWFDKAVNADPTYAPSYVNRAAVSAGMLEYGAAEEDLLHALKLNPLNADALTALGVVQKRQGNFNGARLSFEQAISIAPDHAHARFNLGVLLADDLKKPDDAVRLFQEVLQIQGASQDLSTMARSYINDLKQVGDRY